MLCAVHCTFLSEQSWHLFFSLALRDPPFDCVMCSALYIPLRTVIAPVLFFNPDRSTAGLYIRLSTAKTPVLFFNFDWSTLDLYIPLITGMAPLLFFYPCRSNLGQYIRLSTAITPVLFLNPNIYPGAVHLWHLFFSFTLVDPTWGCTFLSVQPWHLFSSVTLIDTTWGCTFLSVLLWHLLFSFTLVDPTWDCKFLSVQLWDLVFLLPWQIQLRAVLSSQYSLGTCSFFYPDRSNLGLYIPPSIAMAVSRNL